MIINKDISNAKGTFIEMPRIEKVRQLQIAKYLLDFNGNLGIWIQA